MVYWIAALAFTSAVAIIWLLVMNAHRADWRSRWLVSEESNARAARNLADQCKRLETWQDHMSKLGIISAYKPGVYQLKVSLVAGFYYTADGQGTGFQLSDNQVDCLGLTPKA